MEFRFCWYDLWIGVYVSVTKVYICPLPCCCFSFKRKRVRWVV